MVCTGYGYASSTYGSLAGGLRALDEALLRTERKLHHLGMHQHVVHVYGTGLDSHNCIQICKYSILHLSVG